MDYKKFIQDIKRFGLHILVLTLAVYLSSLLFSGVNIDKFTTAIWVAVVLSFFNTYLKPFLVMISMPLTVFSFGIFLIIINAALVYFAARFVSGFDIPKFSTAFWFSIVLSVITSILEKGKGGLQFKIIRHKQKKKEDKFDDYEELD